MIETPADQTTDLRCETCRESVTAEARFCEACGARLSQTMRAIASEVPSPPASRRSDLAAQSNREPSQSDRLVRPGRPKDRHEIVIGAATAAISDRGHRHEINEDAFSIEQVRLRDGGEAFIGVVCDGVSSASNARSASTFAAQSASDFLVNAARHRDDLEAAVCDSIKKAHQAAIKVEIADDGRSEPPGCTIVATVVRDQMIYVAWAGDSRAYWIGRKASRQLTRDHSWLNDVVAFGIMDEEQARRDPRANCITRCVGRLNVGPPEPENVSHQIRESGFLILCSDGLWMYLKDPEAFRPFFKAATPIDVARSLVDHALDQGGVDNISVVVIAIGGRA